MWSLYRFQFFSEIYFWLDFKGPIFLFSGPDWAISWMNPTLRNVFKQTCLGIRCYPGVQNRESGSEVKTKFRVPQLARSSRKSYDVTGALLLCNNIAAKNKVNGQDVKSVCEFQRKSSARQLKQKIMGKRIGTVVSHAFSLISFCVLLLFLYAGWQKWQPLYKNNG